MSSRAALSAALIGSTNARSAGDGLENKAASAAPGAVMTSASTVQRRMPTSAGVETGSASSSSLYSGSWVGSSIGPLLALVGRWDRHPDLGGSGVFRCDRQHRRRPSARAAGDGGYGNPPARPVPPPKGRGPTAVRYGKPLVAVPNVRRYRAGSATPSVPLPASPAASRGWPSCRLFRHRPRPATSAPCALGRDRQAAA